MEKTEKRCKNYTEAEKLHLLEVVSKYKSLESKATDKISVAQKDKIWAKVAIEFNSCAVSGERNVDQLKNLYKNLKRTTKKDVAHENKLRYIEGLNEENVNDFKRQRAHDKKETKKTGGGTFIPQLTEVGAQVLAIVGDQFQPLPNRFDGAAGYFQGLDDDDVDIETETIPSPEDVPSTSAANMPQKPFAVANRKASSRMRSRRICNTNKSLRVKNLKLQRILLCKKIKIANLQLKYAKDQISQANEIHKINMAIKNRELGKK